MTHQTALSTATVVLVALLTLLPASTAAAGVEGEVRSKDKVIGTILPGAELERFIVQCPDGSRLKVKLTGPKKGGALSFRVYDANSDVVPGLPITPKKNGAALKRYDVTAAGGYGVEVYAVDGVNGGDYTLKITCKAPKKRSFDDTVVKDAESYAFFGLVGTTLKAKLKPIKGSELAPRLLRLDGPDGTVIDFTAPAAAVKTDKVVLPLTGDYELFYDDQGEAGGELSGKLSLKEAKNSKRTVDVRSIVIDPNGQGSERAVVGVVGSDGGGFVVPPADPPVPNDITGAGIDLPPGAVSTPTAIVIATAPPMGPPADDLGTAGPTVFFGPEGIQFSEDATVTIPFNPDLVINGGEGLVVYTRDAEGNLTEVPAELIVFDLDAGTCSFPASHFSSFRVFDEQPPLDIETFGDLDGGPVDLADGFRLGSGSYDAYTYDVVVARDDVLELMTDVYDRTYINPLAGGGQSTKDGTAALDFDFGGPVRTVTRGFFGTDVLCATDTQIFALMRGQKSNGLEVFHFGGTGAVGDSGDGGPIDQAQFTAISNLATDFNGRVYIVDRGAKRIRLWDPQTQVVETLMGTGTAGLGQDGEKLASSPLLDPTDIQPDPEFDVLYVADAGRVRLIDPGFFSGKERNETFAGDVNGARGTFGDGEHRLLAQFDTIRHLAVDFSGGQVLVADEAAHTIRGIDARRTGIVRLIVGTPGTPGDGGDSFMTPGPIDTPTSILPGFERLYFTEFGNNRVRRIDLPGQGGTIPPVVDR